MLERTRHRWPARRGAGDTASGGELEGTQWVLRSLLDDGTLVIVPDIEYADAEFTGGRVSGFGGCNEYSAVYRTGDRALFISQAASTQKACAEASMTFESTYLDLLQQSRFYSARDNTLTIFGPNLTTLLVFDAAPANPLLGRWVVDSYATAPGPRSRSSRARTSASCSASPTSAGSPAATPSPGRTARTARSSRSARSRRRAKPARTTS